MNKTLSVVYRGTVGALGNGVRLHGSRIAAQHSLSLAKSQIPVVSSLKRRDFVSQSFSTSSLRKEKSILSDVSVGQLKTDKASAGVPPFAFAFDIDGVLLHQSEPIPGATSTLKYLQANKIPFAIVTNGGGKHEHERVAELSAKLQVPLDTANFVQSHTPFSKLDSLKNKNVLVTGSNAAKAREIAEAYGFKSVIIPADILMANPTIWPFDPLLKSVYAATARPLPRPIYSHNPYLADPVPSSLAKDHLKIDGIMVFNDPRDWALDIQIITDLLFSHAGILGTYSPKNGKAHGWQNDGQPELFFSNPDVLWASKHPLPRMGQGSFQGALSAVWDKARTDLSGASKVSELVSTRFGKPTPVPFHLAEEMLLRSRAELLGSQAVNDVPLKTVYMVGDNPASDIAGANALASQSKIGADWKGILVRTGVWNEVVTPVPVHAPAVISNNVLEGVRWALAREKWAHKTLPVEE